MFYGILSTKEEEYFYLNTNTYLNYEYHVVI